MSKKQNIDELLIRYLQQDIDEDNLRILEAWLEEDAEHKAYFFQMKNIYDYSSRSFLRYEEIAESSWQKMKIRIQKAQRDKSRYQFFTVGCPAYCKYAVLIIIALGIGWSIGEFGRNTNQTFITESANIYNEIRVEKGGRANTILLSDGTKVVLNAETTFKYPTSFGKNERKVFLDGEAYFDVAEDEQKPFVVKLKKQDITVLGTTFNVEAYGNECQSVITLLSGSIALEAFNGNGESVSYRLLKPNQRANADNVTGLVSVLETDATLSDTWINGVYRFKDEPFCSIIKHLERYYGIKIYLEDESLKQVKYTGSFSLDQNIKEVLRIIDYEKRFVLRFENKGIYIK